MFLGQAGSIGFPSTKLKDERNDSLQEPIKQRGLGDIRRASQRIARSNVNEQFVSLALMKISCNGATMLAYPGLTARA